MTVEPRGLDTVRGGFLTSAFDFGGDDEEAADDDGDIVTVIAESGRGAIGIATSTVLLYAGKPSHFLPDRTHF